MLKTHTERVLVDREVIDKIYCNSCGKEIKSPEYGDYIKFNHDWGYNSRKDGESHYFDICEDCYDKFVSTFKVPPTITKICSYNEEATDDEL